MQSRLRKEFGHRFEVSTTQHFVVVHPSGPRSEWGERMESLYRELILSMRVRGIQTSEPDVPLVAVVFHNRDQYFAYARAKGHKLVAETLGHYESQSNRVLLYDDGRTEENLGTIVHEATHQTAYNVGVHRRFAEQPAWLVEGLAMMYETPGVREAWSIQTRKRRINEGRLRNFLAKLDGRPANMIGRLVTSDQLFRTDPVTAYAESWMLSFYLYETRSQDYSRYLARVAARPAFSLYPAKERYADFRAEFGDDLTVLDGQMLRFVEDLKN
jgi:hypothetical protein